MAWEWVAPVGTIVGSMITAGFGGFYGGRKTQERQHQFERESSVRARGREKADQAIESLRVIQRHMEAPDLFGFQSQANDLAERQRTILVEIRKQVERLGHCVEYITDPLIRSEIKMVYDVVSAHVTFMLDRHSSKGVTTEMTRTIWQSCHDALILLGYYVRDASVTESTEYLRKIRSEREAVERFSKLITREIGRS